MFSAISATVALAALARTVSSAYTLEDNYEIDKFSDYFTYPNMTDPTEGFVEYVKRDRAEAQKYVQVQNGSYYMGPDFVTKNPANGRESVRIESIKQYGVGSLVILDLSHQPETTCGVWPAFWMYGPDWPNSGEIDIIESVNTQANNLISLHTGPDCSVDSPAGISEKDVTGRIETVPESAPFQGRLISPNCDVNQPGHTGDGGCSVETQVKNTIGTPFNSAGGGVYATELATTGITVWYFPKAEIPADITAGNPDPTSWTRPVAKFSGTGCDYAKNFVDQYIVFNIDFCGSWAGNVWSTDPVCSKLAPTCNEYVAANPGVYESAYWLVDSLKVYKAGGASPSPSSSSSASSSTATKSTSSTSTATSSTATSSTATPSTATESTSTATPSTGTSTGTSTSPSSTATSSVATPIVITYTPPPVVLTQLPDGSFSVPASSVVTVVPTGSSSSSQQSGASDSNTETVTSTSTLTLESGTAGISTTVTGSVDPTSSAAADKRSNPTRRRRSA